MTDLIKVGYFVIVFLYALFTTIAFPWTNRTDCSPQWRVQTSETDENWRKKAFFLFSTANETVTKRYKFRNIHESSTINSISSCTYCFPFFGKLFLHLKHLSSLLDSLPIHSLVLISRHLFRLLFSWILVPIALEQNTNGNGLLNWAWWYLIAWIIMYVYSIQWHGYVG